MKYFCKKIKEVKMTINESQLANLMQIFETYYLDSNIKNQIQKKVQSNNRLFKFNI